MKKMRQGNASYQTVKEVLGWILDTLLGTLELPQRQKDRLFEILASFSSTRRRAAASKWNSFIGELRSMSPAVPGLTGCFLVLQTVTKPTGRIRITTAAHDQIDDIRWLAKEVTSRPTRIAELVPGPADFIGTTDGCCDGLGSVWLPFTTAAHPPLRPVHEN